MCTAHYLTLRLSDDDDDDPKVILSGFMDSDAKVCVDTPVFDGLAYQGAVVAGGDDNSKTS